MANRAVLHTDASVLPQRPSAWASWNFESAGRGDANICLHYLINRLQPLPSEQPVIVSLNPVRPIAAEHIVGDYDYEHPIFDLAAIRAQALLPQLQGRERTWFCGAWAGHGFHEDGLAAGLQVAELLSDCRWARQQMLAVAIISGEPACRWPSCSRAA